MSASLDIGRFVVQRPGVFYGAAAFPLAAAALSAVPAPLPLVALVGTLRLASHQIVHRPGVVLRWAATMLSVALGACMQHIAPAMSAISSSATSILSLFLLSMLATVIASFPLYLEGYFGARMRGSYSRALVFPAMWATTWAVASMSPVGRLFSWSPVIQDMGPFQWLAPYVGPWGVDWVVGAGAVLFSDVAGQMIMGASPDSEEEYVGNSTGAARTQEVPSLITFEETEDTDVSGRNEGPGRMGGLPPTRARSSSTLRRPLWMLAALLIAAAVPSYFVDTLPLSVTSGDTLAITVGCVLPGPVQGGHPPQFQDFVNASKTLVNSKILIWPEGAVQFTSGTDREAKLAQIHNEVLTNKKNAFVGISFEESIPQGGASGGRYKTQNGFLLLNDEGKVVHEYYKHNLVPIVESFKMIASTEPPELTAIPYPSRQVTRQRKKTWLYEDLMVTTGICMDFASAAPFAGLDERPSLILAPARTWHPAAGAAMWAHAQARAAELGAPALLWCDGGEGGLSGVAGAGAGAHGRLMRAGSGSWETEVAVPLPAHGRARTMYASTGGWGALALVWALVGVGAVLDGGHAVGVGLLPPMWAGAVRMVSSLNERRRALTQKPASERTPLLVDA